MVLASLTNKMKNKKYHTVRQIPKSNIKIVERDKFDTHNTQIHDLSLSWLDTGTCTLMKSGQVRPGLVLVHVL
jgi:hypothetical protein